MSLLRSGYRRFYSRYKAASVEGVEALALYYGAVKLHYRESNRSFTGSVVEVYFDDAINLLQMLDFLEAWMNVFIAVRFVNDRIAYISVPVRD